MLDSGGLATCEPLRKLAALLMDSGGLATCEPLRGAGYAAAGCRGVPWRARSTPRGNFCFPSMGFEMRNSQDSGGPPAPDSTSQSASLTAPLSGEPYGNWRRYRWIQTGSPRASPYKVPGTLPQAVGACRGAPAPPPRGNPRFPSMGVEMRDSQDSGGPPAPDSNSQSASLTAPLSGEPYENWRRYRWIQTGSPRASPYDGSYGILGILPQAVGACRGAPAPLLGGISVFHPLGLKCVIHRTQAGSPRASPYDGSPIRGANGGLHYLWYSNSME